MQRNAESPDGWAFECGACSKQFSIRANTFFSESDLSIPEIVAIMCMFVVGICCYKAHCLIDITPRTIIDWYSVCREICTYAVDMDNIVIGGPGMKVEIVETLMFKRKSVSQQHWLFVGYCVQQKRGFVFPVAKRDRETLLPLIQKHIAPGSLIISDELGAYKDLTSFGWIHRTVDHSQTFVDPKSGAHTQGVKSYWNQIKRHLKSHGEPKYQRILEAVYRLTFRFTRDMPLRERMEVFIGHVTKFYSTNGLKGLPTPPSCDECEFCSDFEGSCDSF